MASDIRKMLSMDVVRRDYCGHRNTEICPENRSVTCKDCKAQLDPFDVILHYAREYNRFSFQADMQKKEAAERAKDLEEVKRQERNAKARLSKLRGKVGRIYDCTVKKADPYGFVFAEARDLEGVLVECQIMWNGKQNVGDSVRVVVEPTPIEAADAAGGSA